MKITGLTSFGTTLLAALGQAHPLDQDLGSKAPRQDISVSNVDGCPDIIVVYGRGTSEPGNIGIVVGPQFLNAMQKAANGKSVGMQGVDYNATFYGFFVGGDQDGATNMAKITTDLVNRCPSSNVAMTGYSQGAQLLHLASQAMPADVMNKVSSVVMFGDPNYGQPVQGVPAERTLSICKDGDTICRKDTLILIPHLLYEQDVDQAAQFIMSKIRT